MFIRTYCMIVVKLLIYIYIETVYMYNEVVNKSIDTACICIKTVFSKLVVLNLSKSIHI